MGPRSGPVHVPFKPQALDAAILESIMTRLSAVACLILLAHLSPPAFADEQLDEPMRESLYVCGVGPTANEGILKLTGVADETGDYGALQFRAEAPGEKPILFPAVPGPGKGNFFFSNTDGPGGYLVSIRFTQGDVKYRLYSLSIPPGPEDHGIYGGGGGLVITEADGSQRKIGCGERAYEFIVYLRKAMSCDTDPRYSAAFCDPYNVPDRVAGDALP